MHRKRLKVALIESELTHWQAAGEANKQLPTELHLSEHDITRLVTCRKNPHPRQAEVLAAVLDCGIGELFPELGSKGGAK